VYRPARGVEKAATIEESNELISKTIHQASVAAPGALSMIESLARFADVKKDGQHIPPVITITSAGPDSLKDIEAICTPAKDVSCS
jgi:hypothetical protein